MARIADLAHVCNYPFFFFVRFISLICLQVDEVSDLNSEFDNTEKDEKK